MLNLRLRLIEIQKYSKIRNLKDTYDNVVKRFNEVFKRTASPVKELTWGLNRKIFNETDEHDARKLYLKACVDWLKEVDRCINLQSEDSRLPSNDQTLVVREPEGHIIQISEPQVAEGSYGEILGEDNYDEQQGLVRSEKVNHRYPEKISNTSIEAEERPTRNGLKNANKTGREGQIGKRREIPLTKLEKFRRTALAAIYGGARGAVAGTLLFPGIGTAVGAAGFAITDATFMYAADALAEKQGREAIRVLGTGEQTAGQYEPLSPTSEAAKDQALSGLSNHWKKMQRTSGQQDIQWDQLGKKPNISISPSFEVRPEERPASLSSQALSDAVPDSPRRIESQTSLTDQRNSNLEETGLLPAPLAWVKPTTSLYNGQSQSNPAERMITFEHDPQENNSPVVSSRYSDSSVDIGREEPSLSDIPQTTQLQQDSGLVENNGHDEISLEASQVPDSGRNSQFLDHTTHSSQTNDSIGLHENFDANNDFWYKNPIYNSLPVDIPHIEFTEDIEASKEAPQSFASSQDLSTRETIHNDIEMDSRQDIAKQEEGPRPEDSSSDQQSRREEKMQIIPYPGSIQDFVRKIGENPQEERPQPSTTSEQPSMQSLLPIDRFLSPNDELPDPILKFPFSIKKDTYARYFEALQDPSSVENSKDLPRTIFPADQPGWNHVLANDGCDRAKPNIVVASELTRTTPTKRGNGLLACFRQTSTNEDSSVSWELRKERQHKLSGGLKSVRRYFIKNWGQCYR